MVLLQRNIYSRDIVILVVISSKAMFTTESLVDMGDRPNLTIKDFLPPTRRKSAKSIELVPLCTANSEADSIEEIVQLFICIGGLRV